jgi:hypothetical protein
MAILLKSEEMQIQSRYSAPVVLLSEMATKRIGNLALLLLQIKELKILPAKDSDIDL